MLVAMESSFHIFDTIQQYCGYFQDFVMKQELLSQTGFGMVSVHHVPWRLYQLGPVSHLWNKYDCHKHPPFAIALLFYAHLQYCY
jgi:hypothetical protein